jgi:hypothetical protein
MTFARSAAARKAGHAIRQISTRRFRDIAKGIAELPNDTVIDGEIVALDENGRPSFNLLQGFGSAQAIVLYAFDLLMLQARMSGCGLSMTGANSFVRLSQRSRTQSAFSETFNVPLSKPRKVNHLK